MTDDGVPDLCRPAEARLSPRTDRAVARRADVIRLELDRRDRSRRAAGRQHTRNRLMYPPARSRCQRADSRSAPCARGPEAGGTSVPPTCVIRMPRCPGGWPVPNALNSPGFIGPPLPAVTHSAREVVGPRHDFEQVSVRVVEVETAPAVVFVQLAFALLAGVGPVTDLSLPDATEHRVELVVADQEGVVLRCDRCLVVVVVERDTVAERHTSIDPNSVAVEPRMSTRNFADFCLSRHQTIV